jgi:peroxiredoxin
MCHLQELHAKYASEGVVVLGINCADDQTIARQLLAENGVQFPNILDTSDDAWKALMQYETIAGWSSVPMTYLIDRDGKVMDAWYGFDKKRSEEAFKKLKLDEVAD